MPFPRGSADTINLMRLSRRRSGTLGAATALAPVVAQTIGPNRTFEERTLVAKLPHLPAELGHTTRIRCNTQRHDEEGS